MARRHDDLTVHPQSSTSVSFNGHGVVSVMTLCHRAHALGITTHEVLSCATIGALQVLVKQHYHQLAREAHPDAQARRKAEGMRPTLQGARFRDLTATYQFLMALPVDQVIDATAGLTIREPPIPWAWDRASLTLGFGYQEIPKYW